MAIKVGINGFGRIGRNLYRAVMGDKDIEIDASITIAKEARLLAGFTEEEIEKVTNCKILWKIPNNYQLIAPAIDKGAPVAINDNQEVSRAFRSFADLLAQASSTAEEGLDLVFQHDKDAKKKSSNRLLINPLRAGQ